MNVVLDIAFFPSYISLTSKTMDMTKKKPRNDMQPQLCTEHVVRLRLLSTCIVQGHYHSNSSESFIAYVPDC